MSSGKAVPGLWKENLKAMGVLILIAIVMVALPMLLVIRWAHR